MNTLVNCQCGPLNELFVAARIVANMRSDTTVDSLYGKVSQGEPEDPASMHTYRAEQDRFFLRILSRRCYMDTPLAAAEWRSVVAPLRSSRSGPCRAER